MLLSMLLTAVGYAFDYRELLGGYARVVLRSGGFLVLIVEAEHFLDCFRIGDEAIDEAAAEGAEDGTNFFGAADEDHFVGDFLDGFPLQGDDLPVEGGWEVLSFEGVVTEQQLTDGPFLAQCFHL